MHRYYVNCIMLTSQPEGNICYHFDTAILHIVQSPIGRRKILRKNRLQDFLQLSKTDLGIFTNFFMPQHTAQ